MRMLHCSIRHAWVALACGLAPLSAAARDYVVTRADDPAIVGTPVCGVAPFGSCSLRQAVLAANAQPGADRILLNKITYSLSLFHPSTDGRSGALKVTDALEVIGVASALTRIRWASGVHHSLSVLDIPQIPAGQVELRALTISHGRGSDGGCVRSDAALRLTDTVVEDCVGVEGGGLHMRATLTLKNTIFRNNQANLGGAFQMAGWNTVFADGASFFDNAALVGGGAVMVRGFPSADGSVQNGLWFNEGQGSHFARNSAPYGGALHVYGNVAFDFLSAPGTARSAVFEDNVATDVGGAVRQWGKKLRLWNTVFRRNAAGSGGAIHADGELLMVNAEFDGNQAQDGMGGALSAPYNPQLPLTRIDIERATFNGNLAALNGGAIASECHALALRNVSFHGNTLSSAQGRGTAILASGDTALTHLSSAGHSSTKPTFARGFHSFCGTRPFAFANSLIGGNDSCQSQVGGNIGSLGGNQFGPGAGQCVSLPGGIDKRQSSSTVFGLSLSTFGGEMPVLGWKLDGQARPQVGFGQAAHCLHTDIRYLLRPASGCDAGAFEQQ